MSYKRFICIYLVIHMIHIGQVKAQFVTTDDFVNINTNYFVTGSLSATNEQKYLISSMRIADRLRQEFAAGPPLFFPSLTTYNGFKIYRGNYPGLTKLNCLSTQPLINFIFIRPNNTTLRRCILLTNGAESSFGTTWNQTLLVAADLLMRGYAVAIYENFISPNGVAHLIAANGSAWKYPCGTNTPCLLTDTENDKFRKLLYSGVQCGIAALQTIMDNTNNASVTNVDTSKIYAMGGSWGGISSVALTYADDDTVFGNVNFINPAFGAMGGFANISRWPNSRYKNVIKAVACVGGGTSINDNIIGNLFDNKDIAPVIFLHALMDSLSTIDSSINLTNINDGRNKVALNNLIGGPAKLDVIQALQNACIKYNVYTNCDDYGTHPFPSSYFQSGNNAQYSISSLNTLTDAQIISLYTNPTTNPTNTATWKRYMYLGFQLLDNNKWICDFFNKASTNPTTITNASKYVIPTTIRNAFADVNNDFFSPLTNISNLFPNGKYINSPTTCINIPLTSRSNTLKKANLPLPQITTEAKKSMNDYLSIYPIPTSNILNIDFKVDNSKYISIKFFDSNGMLIKSIIENQKFDNGIYTQMLDLSTYSNGYYYMMLIEDNSITSTKSFSILK